MLSSMLAFSTHNTHTTSSGCDFKGTVDTSAHGGVSYSGNINDSCSLFIYIIIFTI